jgi:hypothetical protein
MDIVFTFDKHLKEPEKTFNEYLKERKLEFGQSIKKIKKIYLDTKFWLLIREACLDRARNPSQKELFDLICDLSQNKEIICPISEDVFVEIIKQTDAATLKASIELIDKFSNGITLVSQEERWQTEVFHFIRSSVYGENAIHPIDEFVWVKLAYTHGVQTPYLRNLSLKQNNLIQKSFLDQMWSMSLTDIYNTVGIDSFKKYPHAPNFSHILNKEKENYHREALSFKQIYLSEIAFIIDFKKDYFKEMFIYLYKKHFSKDPDPDEVAKIDAGQMFANLIYRGFRLGKIENKLPTFDIEAGINAQIIYDLKRQYKANDIHDINHAVAALPYCDMFFTEKNLRTFVTRKNLSYATKYNCNVVSEIDDAILELKKITG